MKRILKKCFIAMSAIAVLSACETTDVAPIDANKSPEQNTDEAGLWRQVDRYEKELKTSALLERDPELNAYIRETVCKITGQEYCQDLRIYILNRPAFNASMYPNGLMEVWTGLLLRAENEAQLAFVLGHEFTHYKNRHSLKNWRTYKNLANANLFLSLGLAAGGAGYGADLGKNAALLAALTGYGRDLERNADEEGFAVATAAGYDGQAAAQIWEALIAEVQASDDPRKKRRIARASLFSSHPVTGERIATLKSMAAATEQANPQTNSDTFANLTQRFTEEWLQHDLVRRDFGENLFLIDRKIAQGKQLGVLYYRRGEVHRLRRLEGDAEQALKDYQAASQYFDAPAETWRQLGDLYRRQSDKAAALEAYRLYVQKAPEASDRQFVDSYIKELLQ